MTKIAFTSVLLYKVIATLRNYHKDFSCTHLVSAKCQNRKDNYLKVGNHSRHLPSTCRFLSDRYVVFELIALVIIVRFCQQLPAEAGCYTLRGQREEDVVLFLGRFWSNFQQAKWEVPGTGAPGSGRGDRQSDGWGQHTLHIIWFIYLGSGSVEALHVWDLGPWSNSVWYNPTTTHTNQPFYSKETQLVQIFFF